MTPSPSYWQRMSDLHPAIENTSIFVDFEIETFTPHVLYPSLQEFLGELDSAEPHRDWSKLFLAPLTRSGVQHLDDMELVLPEYLYILYKLPPVMVMDFFAHVHDSIQSIHKARPVIEAKNRGQNVLGYVNEPTYMRHQLRLGLDVEHSEVELFVHCDRDSERWSWVSSV